MAGSGSQTRHRHGGTGGIDRDVSEGGRRAHNQAEKNNNTQHTGGGAVNTIGVDGGGGSVRKQRYRQARATVGN